MTERLSTHTKIKLYKKIEGTWKFFFLNEIRLGTGQYRWDN